MTRKDLVKFLTENYNENETLLWHTMTRQDVGMTEKQWEKIMEKEGCFSDAISQEMRELVFSSLENEE